MPNKSFRDGHTLWKRLRTKDTFTDDPDWVGTPASGVPADNICGTIPFYYPPSVGKNTFVEFVVIPFTLATGLVVAATQTFVYEPTFVHDLTDQMRPANSAVRGQTGGSATSIATRKTAVTGALFNDHRRFSCDGADKFTIRLHTFSATPAGADEIEIWYRCVVE